MKINFDVVVCTSYSMVTAVVRAPNGSILAWKTKLLLPSSTLLGEAQACLTIVNLAMEKGWQFCLFEGDAKVVIDACCSILSTPWEIRDVVLEILSYAIYFTTWDLKFISRLGNEAAHHLAAMAYNLYCRGLDFSFNSFPG